MLVYTQIIVRKLCRSGRSWRIAGMRSFPRCPGDADEDSPRCFTGIRYQRELVQGGQAQAVSRWAPTRLGRCDSATRWLASPGESPHIGFASSGDVPAPANATRHRSQQAATGHRRSAHLTIQPTGSHLCWQYHPPLLPRRAALPDGDRYAEGKAEHGSCQQADRLHEKPSGGLRHALICERLPSRAPGCA